MAEEVIDSIDVKLNSLVWASADGFAIYAANDEQFVKGKVLEPPGSLVGASMTLFGKWETHAKYGRQFTFASYVVNEDQIVYFLRRIVRGVPQSAAQAIAAQFGDKLWEMLDGDLTPLLKIPGIKERKLEAIKRGWDENRHLLELGKVLAPYGISTHMIRSVYQEFGDKSVEVIKENPYRLAEIRGIGFRKADEVARKLGVGEDSPERLEACMEYCMQEDMAGNGHSAITIQTLVDAAQAALAVEGRPPIPRARMVLAIDDLIKSGKAAPVMPDAPTYPALADPLHAGIAITSPSLYYMENIIHALAAAKRFAGSPIEGDIDAWIADYEARHGKKFGDQQKEAIRLANKLPGVFSISGYAGTGKTTTSKAILDLLSRHFGKDEIVCCALSGIAANRVKSQSGYPAGTIHSVLGYGGPGNWKYNHQNKLDKRVILLDEGSMCDSEMTYRLMSAIDFDRSILIILGDPAQLPPVGAGSPYSDLLASGAIPNVTLTKIYRQSEDKVITVFANSVRNCEPPKIDRDYSDLMFVDRSISDYQTLKRNLPEKELSALREQNNLEIADDVVSRAVDAWAGVIDMRKQSDYWGAITRFQVVTPIRKGPLGVDELNRRIQEAVNPSGDELQIGPKTLRKGDKIVHLKNRNMQVVKSADYRAYLSGNEDRVEETRVFNGQLGMLVAVRQETEEAHVYYPIEGYIGIYDMDSLVSGVVDLGYALSVHKTQGSEFHTVVFPVTLSHYVMLSPKLIYTAMTRAKESLVIVGQKYAFELGCRREVGANRDTCLSRWAAAGLDAKLVASVREARARGVTPELFQDVSDALLAG